MRRLNRWKSAVIFGVFCLFTFSSEARADLVYTWTGTCDLGCTGTATVTLTLADGAEGVDLSTDSSLFISFSINADNLTGIKGTFDLAGLDADLFEITGTEVGTALLMSFTTNGTWTAAKDGFLDGGFFDGGEWVGPAPIPLPGSLPLFLSSLVAVGLIVFRRRRPKENADLRKPAPAPG
jgi:hypothetical protein